MRSHIHETIVWQGVTLSVTYLPNPYNLPADTCVCHFEIQVISPKDAKLPFTETGYKSHFTHPSNIGNYEDPIDFVRDWLDYESKQPAWQKYLGEQNQMSLF